MQRALLLASNLVYGNKKGQVIPALEYIISINRYNISSPVPSSSKGSLP